MCNTKKYTKQVGYVKDEDTGAKKRIFVDTKSKYYPGYSHMRQKRIFELCKNMSKSCILVFLNLTQIMGGENVFYGSVNDLAERTGTTKKYVIEALKYLESENAIKRAKCAIMVNPMVAFAGKFEELDRLCKNYDEFGKPSSEVVYVPVIESKKTK